MISCAIWNKKARLNFQRLTKLHDSIRRVKFVVLQVNAVTFFTYDNVWKSSALLGDLRKCLEECGWLWNFAQKMLGAIFFNLRKGTSDLRKCLENVFSYL